MTDPSHRDTALSIPVAADAGWSGGRAADADGRPPRPGPGPRKFALFIGVLLTVAFIGYGSLALVTLLRLGHHNGERQFSTANVRAVDIATEGLGVSITGGVNPGAPGVISYRVLVAWGNPHPSVVLASDGTVRIRLSCSTWAPIGCSGHLSITVPAGIPVSARSSGGGINATGLAGDLRLDSSGGGIHATNLRSSRADVQSSGGGIRLGFIAVPSTVHASSSGGGTTVELPDRSGPYAVSARAGGGGSHVDVRQDPRSARTITISSGGGGIHVRYPGD
ncbi:MAG: hypothetical protein ACQSGP_13155 [Frankia sp.]